MVVRERFYDAEEPESDRELRVKEGGNWLICELSATRAVAFRVYHRLEQLSNPNHNSDRYSSMTISNCAIIILGRGGVADHVFGRLHGA